MEVTGKLIKKQFVNENGEPIEYYVVTFDLVNGDKLDVKLKNDKAKLLLLSQSIEKASK